jgi:hypothetical protein
VIGDWSFSSSSSRSRSSGVLAPGGELDRRQGRAPDGTYELRVSRRQSGIFHHAALPDSRTRTTTRRSTKSVWRYTPNNQSTLDFCAGWSCR